MVVRLPVIEDDLPARPKTRGECADVPRPCPFASCRHHLLLDVETRSGRGRARAGTITFSTDVTEPDVLPADASCSLDVADRGGLTLEDVAQIFGLTREAIRQIEARGMERMGKSRVIRSIQSEDAIGWAHADGNVSDSTLSEGERSGGGPAAFSERDETGAKWRDAARNAYERALVARGLSSWLSTCGVGEDGSTREDRAVDASRSRWTAEDQRDVERWLAGELLDADGNPIEWPVRVAERLDLAQQTSEADRGDASLAVAHVGSTLSPVGGLDEAGNSLEASERSHVHAVKRDGPVLVSGPRDLSPAEAPKSRHVLEAEEEQGSRTRLQVVADILVGALDRADNHADVSEEDAEDEVTETKGRVCERCHFFVPPTEEGHTCVSSSSGEKAENGLGGGLAQPAAALPAHLVLTARQNAVRDAWFAYVRAFGVEPRLSELTRLSGTANGGACNAVLTVLRRKGAIPDKGQYPLAPRTRVSPLARPVVAPSSGISLTSAAPANDPIVTSLRARLAEIDSQRARVVSAIVALGGEV